MPVTTARLIFPHQLFKDMFAAVPGTHFIFVEDDLYFTQYPFHKQKLILHRASMQTLAAQVKQRGFIVHYIETSKTPSMEQLSKLFTAQSISTVEHYELVDDWLERRCVTVFNGANVDVERLPTPAFVTSAGQLDAYRRDNPLRMQQFYQWQRTRLNILMDNGKPRGGQWSYDERNRKKLPRGLALPEEFTETPDKYVTEATRWVELAFPGNPGNSDGFGYPITHKQASDRLDRFLAERFNNFGPYEDALSSDGSQVFHSVLSSSLNNGLITPLEVVERSLNYAQQHDTPIESVEGFIRQIIGWREYMRATYQWKGRAMRVKNELGMHRSIPGSWWTAKTGLDPIDHVITNVQDTAYAHHIERLMVLGNAMLLLRFTPDQVYEWFMSLFIDAYDWVMVPNVYAMSQYAAKDIITTKPYISGSNYLMKMSNYKKGEWNDIWDSLYWRFINDYEAVFTANYRSSMMVKLYDGLTDEKKAHIKAVSDRWLE